MEPICRIVSRPIRCTDLVDQVRTARDGAVATFRGVVRNRHRGRAVTRLEYHAYAEMAEEELARIAGEIQNRFPVGRVGLIHRVGTLEVGDVAVLVAVAAPHRRAALAGCAAAIEEVKRRLPIWKKEFFGDHSSPMWVFGPQEPPGDTGAGGAAREKETGE
ncbi:MAG: molybdenum cofactor biosynthesis protein MoaE [Acidobacteriota bacterium]